MLIDIIQTCTAPLTVTDHPDEDVSGRVERLGRRDAHRELHHKCDAANHSLYHAEMVEYGYDEREVDHHRQYLKGGTTRACSHGQTLKGGTTRACSQGQGLKGGITPACSHGQNLKGGTKQAYSQGLTLKGGRALACNHR